jgi:penicillin amidase
VIDAADWWKAGATASAAGAAVAGLVGGTYAALVRRPLPRRHGRVPLTGLDGDVEVVVDTWGVPHVYAGSLPDLVRAQGYLHAQDRLWQLEVNRRIVSGRMAEVVGELAVPLDRWMRTLSLRHVAEQEPALLSGEVRGLLEAYAQGVNARIDEGRLPVEFSLLRHRPEPWSVVDSLAWTKMMALTLCVNWETEILRARVIDRIGAQRAAELEPDGAEGRPYVVPDGVDYSCIGTAALARAAEAERLTGPTAGDGVGIGSNSWVVHGSRTASGKPLLANDMHLGLTIPAIWYENHLHCPGYEVAGVTFPGLPGVVAGHNRRVAWGFTNGFPDVQDLYVEHLRETRDGGVEYEFEGAWHAADVRREVIRVKASRSGTDEVVERVVTTRHGPVINILAPEHTGEQPLALRWTAYEPSPMAEVVFAMNRAESCEQLREALRGWHTPVQNVVYADVDGTIGYSYPGRIPIRAKGDGRVPVPGWTGEYEWTGYLPFDELPHQQDPPAGFVATANNRVVDAGYPHWLGGDFIIGDRAERITELIEAAGAMDVPTIRRMQTDQVSTSARRTAAAIGALRPDDPRLAEVVALMRGWGGTLSADSSQAAVYELFTVALARRLLEPVLGDLTDYYLGKGITPVISEVSWLGERAREWLGRTLGEESSPWWDTGVGQTREQQMLAALADTVDDLTAEFGPDPVRWRWGSLHTLTLRHVLGARPPLDRVFNRGPFPMGGDGDTIWNSAVARHVAQVPDALMVGPPFRYIADLADLGQSRAQLLPGQSGQIGSPHYADNVTAWMRGDYHPMLLDRPAVDGNASERFTLTPPGA